MSKPVARIMGVLVAGSSEATVLARLLAHRGADYDARVIQQHWSRGETAGPQFEREAMVPVIRMDMGWRPNSGEPRGKTARALSLARLLITAPRLYGVARAYGPHLLYSSQQRWDSLVAGGLARLLRRPHVLHLHYNIVPELGAEVLQRLTEAGHVVAVSDFVRAQALAYGVRPDRVTTIHNTTALMDAFPDARRSVRAEFGLPIDSELIGIVARLDPSKGQRDTIAAFATVAVRYPSAHVLIVGGGDREARTLREQASRAGLLSRVTFAGQRADVPRLLGALDVFVHPSRSEPFGLSVLEAMAAGLPVVAYDEGALPELIGHGVTGLLVAPGDTGALAHEMSVLLSDTTRRARIGAEARRRIAEAFRPADAGRAFADLLLRIAHPR